METARRAPEGTIALLFTDIEGSTRLASELGREWPAVLADHHAIVGGAIAEEGGFVDGTEGDAFFAAFAEARAAARAGVSALRRLRSHRWPSAIGELRVRMGLHVGYVERTETGYVGLEVHRAARIAGAANGGQLLITAPALALIGDQVEVQPLGAHRLRDFPAPELLFCAVVDGRGAELFPPPRTQRVRPTNLPPLTEELVGREHELERIRDALVRDGGRIVTLSGRGGAGKTSLALTAAAGLLDQHPGGVWLVRLAAISSPEGVLPAVAGVIGAKGASDDSALDAITGQLSGRGRTLIMLDNLEHLLPAAASLAALVDAAPELRLLITSQAPLRVTRERCLAVDALDEESAIALIERVARSRDSSLRVADDDRPVLAEIVSILDGLPLALELAGAQLRLLTPSQLRDRLRDSAELLRNDMRDRPDRHRSLRATVEWTLATLQPAARELFVRIGAFAGPVEFEEVEAVTAADGLDVLAAMPELLDRALIRRIEAGDGRLRFGLPEALREIAASMLGSSPEGDRWRREHAHRQHELQWAARNCWVPEPIYRAAISADTEAAAALRWAQEIDDPLAAPLAAARARLLAQESRLREAVAVIAPLLRSRPSDREVQGQAQIANALTLGTLGRRAEALEAATAAVELVTEPESRASALAVRALEHLWSGQTDAALSDHETATALARQLHPTMLSEALFLESQARMQAGQLELAAELIDEAVEVGQRGNSPHLWGRYSFEGDLAVLRGRPREALEHYSVALEHAQEHHDHIQVYMDLCGLAEALVMSQSPIQALEVCGIAEAQITDAGAPPGSTFVGEDFQRQAQERVGARAAAEARKRGRQVEVGYRVTRACELARVALREVPRPGLEPASGP